MFPKSFARPLNALILAGIMSCIVTFVSTWRVFGFGEGFIFHWLIGSWLPAWAVAFPSVFVVGPFTQRLVAKIIRP